MPTDAPQLSVVIVNYNTRELLRACLQSLAQPDLALEIIVVDNASADGSAAMVAADFPQVRLLAQTHNTWFCGGNNLGSAAATGDYVLLLNPDTVVRPGALGLMLAWLAAHPSYAGATARLIYPDGREQRTCSRLPRLAYLFAEHTPLGLLRPAWRARLQAEHWYSEWQRDSDHDVAVVPGSCTLVRRADAQLDAGLLLYYPEEDLARRLGKPFRYLSAAIIEHHEKAATQSWRATRIYFRDMLRYVRRHHGLAWAALLWLGSRPLLAGMWLARRLRH